MRFNSISYLITEGFRSVFKQKKMTSASIIIMCATMFMFGVFFVIGENVNFVMKQVESQQGMRVMIKDDATQEEKEALKVKIQKIDGVSTIEFVSREEALNSMRQLFGEHQELLDEYQDENFFPESYFVTLTDLSKNEEVQQQILQLNKVDEISTSNDRISKLSSIARGIQTITLVLLLLLIIISIFIISYTIKLTVYARRREISIMKYVGATNSFIRGPFVIEGIIIGIIAAFLTLAIIGFAYNGVMNGLTQSTVIQRLTVSFYTFSELFVRVMVVYLILGIGIGVLGSSISMRKYLKV